MPAPINTLQDGTLHEQERRHFLSLLMTVAYGLLTRPDAAVYVTALQRESRKAKAVHVKRLNTPVRWMQQHPRALTYAPMAEYPTQLVVFSDSGFQAKSTSDGLSVRGMISLRMAATQAKRLVEGGPQPEKLQCHILEYASKALRRVTRSTFASELFACADAIDQAVLTRTAVSRRTLSEAEARDPEW